MKNAFLTKLKESALSIAPIVILVLIASFTPLCNFTTTEFVTFIICSILYIVGVALFNLGADVAMSPMGEHVGSALSKTKSIFVLLAVTFVLGTVVTVAEPDLSVLATQVSYKINPTLLTVTVGVGMGILLVISVLKIVLRKSLSLLLVFFYMVIFALTALLVESGNDSFVALAFDSGGVTTGPVTVPFIMALGLGISQTLGGRDSAENSFGLLALCSVGPVISVILLGLNGSSQGTPVFTDYSMDVSLKNVLDTVKTSLSDVGIALLLIVVFFAVLQFICLKLPRIKLLRIGMGIVYTFVGLVIFLSAVAIGFMPIGYKLGMQLAEHDIVYLIVFGLVIGMVTVIAEPSVHVLNKQVEEVTDRAITSKTMLIALAIGVGISIALCMVRIWLHFSVLYYLIPGYILSLGLSFFVPKIYTAIAFDSGGVASGSLASSFILPFAIGVCTVLQGESAILTDAFGIIAIVAMTPLITIQLLGFRSVVKTNVRNKIAQTRILRADDEQIINFM